MVFAGHGQGMSRCAASTAGACVVVACDQSKLVRCLPRLIFPTRANALPLAVKSHGRSDLNVSVK